MSIEKTIETVRSHEGEISISEICDLADAYEAKESEVAELREALEHYADRQTWACGNTGYLHECGCDGQKTGDCSKCYYNSYQGDGQGWETAQAVLDKYK